MNRKIRRNRKQINHFILLIAICITCFGINFNAVYGVIEESAIEKNDPNVQNTISDVEESNSYNPEVEAINDDSDVKIYGLITEDVEIKSIEEPEEPLYEEPQEAEPVEVEPIVTNFIETDVITNNTYSVENLRATLEIIAPNLVGIEEALIENQQLYGISPEFQIAVFCVESAYGKSKLACNKNNLAGLGAYPAKGKSAYQNAKYFETKADCVRYFGSNLNRLYLSEGRTDISSIAKKYCPPNWSNWISMVNSIKNKVSNKYASI